MKSLFIPVFAICICQLAVHAQAASQEPGAKKVIQESERSTGASTVSAQDKRKVKISAGTPLEIEAIHTVRSVNVRPNDYLSFRVLVPIRIEDVTVLKRMRS